MPRQAILRIVIACICITSILGPGPIRQSRALKHGDGLADGHNCPVGRGIIIRFALPEETATANGIRIHGSRYGTPEPPNEKFLIYFLSQDMSEFVRAEMAPYSLFEEGAQKWVDVKFRRPIELPKEFWVALDFRTNLTKGVYFSYDTSTGGKFSRIGLPGIEAKETRNAGDWMIEVLLTN